MNVAAALQAPAATQSSASESDEGEDGSKVINGGKKSGKERKTSTEIAEEVAKGMTTHAVSLFLAKQNSDPCPSKLTNVFSLTCFSLVLEVGKVKIVIVRPHLVATDLRRDTREIPLSSPNVSSSASESELEAADTFPPALEANTRFLQMSTTAAAATKVGRKCMDGTVL